MKCSEPLVCICIPNYNNEKTIADTLDSLLSQTYKNIVIKIFDNASTDSSLKIILKYQEKYNNIQVFESEKNIGAESNFTRCIDNMEGKYSAIYHSDDIYMPTIVEEEIQYLEANDNCCAVFTNAYLIDENGKIFGESYFPSEFSRKEHISFNFLEILKLTMQYDNFLQCPSAMVKTHVYRNEIKKWAIHDFKSASDVAVWFRLAKVENIAVLKKILYKYRVSINSYSYRELRKRTREKDFFKVLDFYIEHNKKHLDEVDFDNYNFLRFKESLLITKNQILTTQNNLKPKVFKSIRFNGFLSSLHKSKFLLFWFLLKVIFYFLGFLDRR